MSCRTLGLEQTNAHYFDTLRVDVPNGIERADTAAQRAARHQLPYIDETTVGIALNETVDTTTSGTSSTCSRARPESREPRIDFDAAARSAAATGGYPPALRRTSAFLTHPVFNTHRSETQMMRYIRALERKDIGLDTSMIPLGSCTMKLNAATEMLPVTWEHFSRMHPFAPVDQAQGYAQIFRELEAALCEITGFAAVSLQPNSGAQGEFAGLMVIRAYHRDRGDAHRDVVLIPASAHGTNPASAAMAGMRVVVVATAPNGNVDVADLRKKAAEHGDRLSCLMITYPSTHGVFEDDIREICAHRARARRAGVHGRRQHERAGRPDQPGADRRRRLPPEPAQDVRHPARRRRAGDGADRRRDSTWRRTCPAIRW